MFRSLASTWRARGLFPRQPRGFIVPSRNALAALDPGVYVYPEWETHVTIMTFVNFSLHRRPAPERLAELQSLINPVRELIRPLLARAGVRVGSRRAGADAQSGHSSITDASGRHPPTFDNTVRSALAVEKADCYEAIGARRDERSGNHPQHRHAVLAQRARRTWRSFSRTSTKLPSPPSRSPSPSMKAFAHHGNQTLHAGG